MPVKPAAAKALRQTAKRRAHNLQVIHRLKKLNVRLRKALTAKDGDQAKSIVAEFTKTLDKATQQGILHRNTAARKKSRIARSLQRS